MFETITPEVAAIFFARVLLGILFAVQGYDKIFSMKIKTLIQTIEPAYRKIRMPDALIAFAAYFTSYVEFFGGILLILGLFKYVALYLLGFDLLIVALGLSLVDPVWKMDIVFPRFILLVFILLFPPSIDICSLDWVLFR